MNNKNSPCFVPESFEEYQNLPEKVKEEISNYVLREAVVKISQTVIAPGNLKGSENAQEGLSELLKQSQSNYPKQPFLINLGLSLTEGAEKMLDWLYDKYMKLAYKLHRRNYE